MSTENLVVEVNRSKPNQTNNCTNHFSDVTLVFEEDLNTVREQKEEV